LNTRRQRVTVVLDRLGQKIEKREGFVVGKLKPDLNTSFRQAADITRLPAKFGRPWHYASDGRGVLRRVWAAALPVVARSA
jgi:hypothetical protein